MFVYGADTYWSSVIFAATSGDCLGATCTKWLQSDGKKKEKGQKPNIPIFQTLNVLLAALAALYLT